jgi:hypothetical protein
MIVSDNVFNLVAHRDYPCEARMALLLQALRATSPQDNRGRWYARSAEVERVVPPARVDGVPMRLHVPVPEHVALTVWRDRGR